MPDNPAIQRKPGNSRKSAPSRFVVKEEHGDGSTTWVDPETLEEITLHSETAPTEAYLRDLAKNGILPRRPTLDDLDDENELSSNAGAVIPYDDAPEDALSRVLTRIKTVATAETRSEVKIYRVKDAGKEAYCGSCSVEEYDEFGEEWIRARFGAGSYRVRVYGPAMQEGSNYGKFVRLTNTLVEIEPSLLPVKSTLPGAANSDASAALGAAGAGALLPILQNLAHEIATLKAGPQRDPMDEIKRIAEIAKLFNGNGQSKSVVEQMKEMELMLGLRRKLADEREGEGGDGKPDMMDMAGKVLSLITPQPGAAPAVQGIPAGSAEIAPTVQIPSALYPAHADPAMQPSPYPLSEGEPVNPIQSSFLLITVNALMRAADRGDAPDKHAPGLADKMPDEVIDALETDLWFDFLASSVPPEVATEIEKRRQWFTVLRDKILENVYQDDDQTGAQPAPSSGPAL